MKNPLENLHYALVLGVILAFIVFLVRGHYALIGDLAFWAFFVRYIHVLSGILWIGLLYYFNFVQIPSMPRIPDEQKPAIGRVIAPAALFLFRWAAAVTVVFGLLTAFSDGYIVQALTLQQPTIGIGMWIALVMAFNIWFVIWPSQKKALGLVPADANARKTAARVALLVLRIDTMLSIPMLYCMVAQQNIG